jgi:hypothetical protein
MPWLEVYSNWRSTGNKTRSLTFFNHGNWSRTYRLLTLSNSSTIPQCGMFRTETPNPICSQPWKRAKNGHVIITWSWTLRRRQRCAWTSRPVLPLIHQYIVINNQTINIVTHAKLLGVTISSDLKWNLHVNAICKKASKRLYALRLLKRNALPDSVLVKFYRACVDLSLSMHAKCGTTTSLYTLTTK